MTQPTTPRPSTQQPEGLFPLEGLSSVLQRRWRWLVGSIVILSLLMVAAGFFQTARYESTARVLIGASPAQQALTPEQNAASLARQISNEATVANSDAVLTLASDLLGREMTDAEGVVVRTDPAGDQLSFTASAPSAVGAAQLAEAWADAYVLAKRNEAESSIESATVGLEAQLADLQLARAELTIPVDEIRSDLVRADTEAEQVGLQFDLDLASASIEAELNRLDSQQEQLTQSISALNLQRELALTGTARVVNRATIPTSPVGGSMIRNLFVGIVSGALVGVALALGRDRFGADRRQGRPGADGGVAELTGHPVLGHVPALPECLAGLGPQAIEDEYPDSEYLDSYRRIRASIVRRSVTDDLRSVLVVSPNGTGVASAMVAANLSWSIGRRDLMVTLLDCQLRTPRLHRSFGIDDRPGIADYVEKRADLDDIHHQPPSDDTRGVDLVPTGGRCDDPAEMLASTRFAEMLVALEDRSEFVVLSGAPVTAVSDSVQMCRLVDGVVLVIENGTDEAVVIETVQQLEAVGASIIGSILTGDHERALPVRMVAGARRPMPVGSR